VIPQRGWVTVPYFRIAVLGGAARISDLVKMDIKAPFPWTNTVLSSDGTWLTLSVVVSFAEGESVKANEGGRKQRLQ